MCQIKRIDDFLAEWPDAEWGPGHCILSDSNVEDDFIDTCIRDLRAILGEGPWPAPDYYGIELWKDVPADEARATLEFMLAFREIPEDERVGDADHLCGEA